MLALHAEARVERLKLRHRLSVECLEENGACSPIPHVSVLADTAHRGLGMRLRLVDAYNQIVDNQLGVVAMRVAWSRLGSVVFEAVPSIKKFTDIAARIDLKNEFAARVVIDKFADVEYHLIQNDKTLASLKSSFELLGAVPGRIPLDPKL